MIKVEENNNVNMTNEIIIRSVYGKVNQIYFINPCPNPKTLRLPKCVKPVNANGDMILSEKEVAEMGEGKVHFVKADHVFEIVDGTRFDLDDIVDAANWEAIKYSSWIAKDRYERNEQGELVIDGGAKRYGNADLYVDRPGEVTRTRVNKKELIHRACSYVYEDSEVERIKKTRLLGRNDLQNSPRADVIDYLIDYAEKKPNTIIELYEGEGWAMQLFILDALDRGVIRRSDGIFRYDDKILGASESAVAIFLKDIRYKAILNSIKRETYPELMRKAEVEELGDSVLEDTPHAAPKSVAKKAPIKKK